MQDELAYTLVCIAKREATREVCGLVLEWDGELVQRSIKNVSPIPQHRFEMDPEELVAAYREAEMFGAKVIGVYHSHPRGPAQPSKVDKQYATLHPDLRQWIVTTEGVYEWSSDGDGS
jgi:proteasome lid subunit RPN8/RPN11